MSQRKSFKVFLEMALHHGGSYGTLPDSQKAIRKPSETNTFANWDAYLKSNGKSHLSLSKNIAQRDKYQKYLDTFQTKSGVDIVFYYIFNTFLIGILHRTKPSSVTGQFPNIYSNFTPETFPRTFEELLELSQFSFSDNALKMDLGSGTWKASYEDDPSVISKYKEDFASEGKGSFINTLKIAALKYNKDNPNDAVTAKQLYNQTEDDFNRLIASIDEYAKKFPNAIHKIEDSTLTEDPLTPRMQIHRISHGIVDTIKRFPNSKIAASFHQSAAASFEDLRGLGRALLDFSTTHNSIRSDKILQHNQIRLVTWGDIEKVVLPFKLPGIDGRTRTMFYQLSATRIDDDFDIRAFMDTEDFHEMFRYYILTGRARFKTVPFENTSFGQDAIKALTKEYPNRPSLQKRNEELLKKLTDQWDRVNKELAKAEEPLTVIMKSMVQQFQGRIVQEGG